MGYPATVYDKATGLPLRSVRIVNDAPDPSRPDGIRYEDTQGRWYVPSGAGRLGLHEIPSNDTEERESEGEGQAAPSDRSLIL